MRMTLQYFKESGKYYSSGYVDLEEGDHFWARLEALIALLKEGHLPGLVSSEWPGPIHVIDETSELPHIILPEHING